MARRCQAMTRHTCTNLPTVSFHKPNSQCFKWRVSNPRTSWHPAPGGLMRTRSWNATWYDSGLTACHAALTPAKMARVQRAAILALERALAPSTITRTHCRAVHAAVRVAPVLRAWVRGAACRAYTAWAWNKQERQTAERRTVNATRENRVLSTRFMRLRCFWGYCAVSRLLLCASCLFRALTAASWVCTCVYGCISVVDV